MMNAQARAAPSEAALRPVAGAILHAHLAGRKIPEHVPGDFPRLRAAVDAWEDAPRLLDLLAELYGVEHWTFDEYKRVVVKGALAGWRPGAQVHESPDAVRLVADSCPIGSEVERDARACLTCRVLQEHVAHLALDGKLARIEFPQLMSRGDAACVVDVHVKKV